MADEVKVADAAGQTADAGAAGAQIAAPTPEDIAKVFARIQELETANHGLKSALGRKDSQLKLAASDKLDAILSAYDVIGETKARLIAQGYSESVVETLAASNPAALKDLEKSGPAATGTAATAAPNGLSEESAALALRFGWTPPGQAAPAKAAGARADMTTARVAANGGGSPMPGKRSAAEIADGAGWNQKEADEYLRSIGAR